MKPTQEQYAAFEKAFDYFNQALFGGSLPSCLLNFGASGKTRGYFRAMGWIDDVGSVTDEISLNPAYVNKEDPRRLMSTLVHEMAHLARSATGERSRGYHSKEWAKLMLTLGLIPTSTGVLGGRQTGYKVTHCIEEGGAFAKAFDSMPTEYHLPLKGSGAKATIPPTGKPTGAAEDRKLKVTYTCPGCKTRVWGKPGLTLACFCGEVLLRGGATPDPETRRTILKRMQDREEQASTIIDSALSVDGLANDPVCGLHIR